MAWIGKGQIGDTGPLLNRCRKQLDIFRILADYRLRHLVNNVAIHMITLEWR